MIPNWAGLEKEFGAGVAEVGVVRHLEELESDQDL